MSLYLGGRLPPRKVATLTPGTGGCNGDDGTGPTTILTCSGGGGQGKVGRRRFGERGGETALGHADDGHDEDEPAQADEQYDDRREYLEHGGAPVSAGGRLPVVGHLQHGVGQQRHDERDADHERHGRDHEARGHRHDGGRAPVAAATVAAAAATAIPPWRRRRRRRKRHNGGVTGHRCRRCLRRCRRRNRSGPGGVGGTVAVVRGGSRRAFNVGRRRHRAFRAVRFRARTKEEETDETYARQRTGGGAVCRGGGRPVQTHAPRDGTRLFFVGRRSFM